MEPSGLHEAPTVNGPDSQITAGGPPSIGIFFSLPSAANPTHRPSGEKNGFRPPSVPASGVTSSWSSRRRHKRVVSPCWLAYTTREPSGETASECP